MKIVVAGATGYLGAHIVRQLMVDQRDFMALARNTDKLKQKGLKASQIIGAEVTKPATLEGKLAGADVIISTIGITRQKDGLTYMDVDYQANMNLLHEAQNAGVRKFIYVSVINGRQMRHLKIVEAKEKFVDALKDSGMDFCVIRPNGFFSDMKDFLSMAKKGSVYLFGDGEYKLNPIHGADLAQGILESIHETQQEIELGGPDILTQNELAELALSAWGKPKKIVHLPDWTRRLILKLLRTFTGAKTYGPYEFFLTLMAQNNIAPRYGMHRIKRFYKTEVDKLYHLKKA